MAFEYNQDELDVGTAVSLLNRLARENPGGEGLSNAPLNDVEGEEFTKENIHYYIPLTFPIDNYRPGRPAELFEETTFLSEREAHIVALKEIGLSHAAIAMWFNLTSEGMEKSTVDEYSRRAKQKYLKAKRTIDELEELYGGDE